MTTQKKLPHAINRALQTAAIGLGLFSMLAVLSPTTSLGAERELRIGNERVTAVPMTYEESQIVRHRTAGKDAVTFSAMDAEIDSAAVVVFEIESQSQDQSVSRWRCVAERNVNECFEKPVRIKYLDNDESVVMTVRIQAAAQAPRFLAHR